MLRFLPLSLALLVACAGTTRKTGHPHTEKTALNAEDMAPRARLDRAQFATAVDAKRYRIAAPPSTDFVPTDDVIYLVGKIRSLPTNAAIEVRWFHHSDSVPQAVSDTRGSATYQFIASFHPNGERFRPGAYTARVYVNHREVGSRPFTVLEDELARSGPAIHDVAISTRVTRKMQAKKPRTAFKKHPAKLFATFDVTNLDNDVVAEVDWYRNDEPFHSQTITLSGNQRYGAHIASAGGLPGGEYTVAVSVEDRILARQAFAIASDVQKPTIDAIALGLELDQNNRPIHPVSEFTVETAAIHCGLSFVNLSPETTLVIQWIKIEPPADKQEESVLYMNRMELPWGGTGTVGANWQPYDIEPGKYKVAVLLGEETVAESPFEVVDVR